jgi:hypothetical protein
LQKKASLRVSKKVVGQNELVADAVQAIDLDR